MRNNITPVAIDKQLEKKNSNSRNKRPISLRCFLMAMLVLAFETQALAQLHDRTIVLTCSANTEINVLANGLFTCTDVNTTISILEAPKHGTAGTPVNSTISYIPDAGYQGPDSLLYLVRCNGTDLGTVWMHLAVTACPDNIDTTSCVGTPQTMTWDIREEMTIDSVRTTYSFVVGDLNDDGRPDIAAYTPELKTINVFWGPEFTTKTSIPIGETPKTAYYMALGKVKISDGVYKSLIFTAYVTVVPNPNYKNWGDYTIVAYDPENPSVPFWKTSNNTFYGPIGLADFNNDGYTELYLGNKIYDAATGVLLCDGGAANNKGSTLAVIYQLAMPQAADIIGDSRLELIAGNQIYDVQLSPTRAANSGTMNVVKSVTPPTNLTADGLTVVADFDNDGKLEVLVRSRNKTNAAAGTGDQIHLYLWTPHTTTPTILAKTYELNSYFGIPFVGNIDDDPTGQIEIVTLSSDGKVNSTTGVVDNQPGHFRARRYNKITNSFDDVWRWDHKDQSGATVMTLFDFYLSGKAQIVYRDEEKLRIIDGSATTLTTLFETPAYSETSLEYPIVADIFGTGHANILVTSEVAPVKRQFSQNAKIKIYGGSEGWAPARKVWNQYNYNVVNVNEDLTIPQYQMSPAKFFPNGKQPYNAFLQQQTALNKAGDPIMQVSNTIWVTEPTVTVAGDSAIITGHIANIGKAALNAPIYVSFYKNDTAQAVLAANFMKLDSIMHMLRPGENIPISFTINNLSQYRSISKIFVSVNDKAGIYPYQEQCALNGRSGAALKLANDDYAQLLTCTPSITIDVLANDTATCNRTDIVNMTIKKTSAAGAAASFNGNKDLVYHYPANFTGLDSLQYEMTCMGVTDSAWVYMTVVACPDNMDTSSCAGTPQPMTWDMQEAFRSTEDDLCTYDTPVVGDLDNDGIPEILAVKFKSSATNRDRTFSGIYIYWGSNRSQPTFIPTVDGNYMTGGAISIAKVKTGAVYKPIIVMVGHADGYLYAYEPTATNANGYLWKSDQPVIAATYLYGMQHFMIGIADFDNDGNPEIYAGKRIFDAATGMLLVEGPANGNTGYNVAHDASIVRLYYPAAADVTGDGRLEYLAGTEAYKVTITNRSGTAGNRMDLMAEIPAVDMGTESLKDGVTVVADINRDGRLDIVVTSKLTGIDSVGIIAWDVQTQTLIAKGIIPVDGNLGNGVPLIGNIDNDPNVEILLPVSASATIGRIEGFRWNGTQTFEHVYTYNTSDKSGMAGLTLFDFTQSGVNEIVYRDETQLRIMRAKSTGGIGTFEDLTSISAGSGTGLEYPVIADVDGDGAAEIVSVSREVSSIAHTGNLRIYKSHSIPWAPARKVWNQYAYNVVNVNEDLTIPSYQINPAVVLSNGKQPYNNYLQQQTILNKYGEPVLLVPNIVWVEEPSAVIAGDSAVFTGRITNIGSAALDAPIYVSFYKNDTVPATLAANFIRLDSISQTLLPGDSVSCSFTIKNLSQYAPISKVFISVNDKAGIYPYRQQCALDGRRGIALLYARNDTITASSDSVAVAVLANDDLAECATAHLDSMKLSGTPHHGIARLEIVSGDTLVTYKRAISTYCSVLRDSIAYTIYCSGNESTAWVFFDLPNIAPAIVLNLQYNLSICQGDSINLNTAILPGSAHIDTIAFYSDKNYQVTMANPVVQLQGYYYVKVNNHFGCSVFDSVYVHVRTKSLHTEQKQVCQHTSLNWRGRDIPTDVAGYFTHTDSLLTIHGCDSVFTLDLEVLASPAISSFTATTNQQGSVMILSPVTLRVIPTGYANYQFILNTKMLYDGPSNEVRDIRSPLYYNGKTNHSTVEVTDNNGCKNTEKLDFDLKVVIPNAFQPGNAYNETFLKGYDIKIFNRFGHVLYQGNTGWDGKYKGQDMPTGTYYYEIILPSDDKKTQSYKGAVLLERSY